MKKFGWLGNDLAKQAFDLLGGDIPKFEIKNRTSYTDNTKRMMGHLFARKLLGTDIPLYPQQTGDCTSFGAKHAVELTSCCDILMRGEFEKFRPIFPPYIYGCSRVFIGKNSIRGAGSLGIWTAKAVQQYGCIWSDDDGVPKYSGSIADSWGRSSSSLNKFVDIGKKNLVRTITKITSWKDACEAIANGYFVTLASNRGFEMLPRSDGFHYPKGTWPHQMCLFGFDNEYKSPFGLIQNNWGNVHGELHDFETNDGLPEGCLRVRAEVIESDMLSDDCWAYSTYDGCPEQRLDKILFDFLN